MTGFAGFQRHHERYVSVPDAFFTALLPEIRSAVELKVTLHLMWILSQRLGRPRCIEFSDLSKDAALLESLKVEDGPRPAQDYLREGLELATTRGSVLQVRLRRPSGRQSWYFLNTPASRESVEKLQNGLARDSVAAWGDEPIHEIHVYRPNVFALYEQNIGALTPMMAEHLRAAEETYPREWIEDAIRLAVEYNKRSWRYIESILRRWEVEGRSDGTDRRHSEEDIDPESYFRSKYRHLYR